jgi:hypothetical protein
MQDSIAGISGCTSSRVGRDLVWKFLQKNWTKLVERYGEKSSFLIYFVEVKNYPFLFGLIVRLI